MGKRKSSKPPPKKKGLDALPTTFRCLFCNSENSVFVKIDKKTSTGTLGCKICGQVFETTTHVLSAPVDVYADWVDACDAVAKEQSSGGSRIRGAGRGEPAAAGRLDPVREDQYEDDGFIERDDEDDEGGYRPE